MSAIAQAISLEHDAFGRLVLTLPSGERAVEVTPVRCFPFSAPQTWVSFLDSQGREVHAVPDLAALPAQVRKALEEELAQRELLPRIERIVSVSSGPDPTAWNVRTDRGEVRFTLVSEDHIRPLPPRGAILTDANGMRYQIVDTRALDAHSRRLLSRYL